MHENIRACILGNESIAFGIIEPLYLALHQTIILLFCKIPEQFITLGPKRRRIDNPITAQTLQPYQKVFFVSSVFRMVFTGITAISVICPRASSAAVLPPRERFQLSKQLECFISVLPAGIRHLIGTAHRRPVRHAVNHAKVILRQLYAPDACRFSPGHARDVRRERGCDTTGTASGTAKRSLRVGVCLHERRTAFARGWVPGPDLQRERVITGP